MRSEDGFWAYPMAVARLWALDDLARRGRTRVGRKGAVRRGRSGLSQVAASRLRAWKAG